MIKVFCAVKLFQSIELLAVPTKVSNAHFIALPHFAALQVFCAELMCHSQGMNRGKKRQCLAHRKAENLIRHSGRN